MTEKDSIGLFLKEGILIDLACTVPHLLPPDHYVTSRRIWLTSLCPFLVMISINKQRNTHNKTVIKLLSKTNHCLLICT